MPLLTFRFHFFFNDTATTEIYTLSLHDALPILVQSSDTCGTVTNSWDGDTYQTNGCIIVGLIRSEEHTSELQSLTNLVCRLLLEKKKKKSQLIRLHLHHIQSENSDASALSAKFM